MTIVEFCILVWFTVGVIYGVFQRGIAQLDDGVDAFILGALWPIRAIIVFCKRIWGGVLWKD